MKPNAKHDDISLSALARCAREAGVTVPEAALPGLAEYLQLLCRWNKAMNLVGAHHWRDAMQRLVADSFHLATFLDGLPLPEDPLCWDLGSGAGLPAIPLRMAWQRGTCWLVEAREKRALFLSTVLARVPLPGTHVFRGRVEHFFPKQARKADCITSRAFMPWPQLLELVAPHLADDGIGVSRAREEPPAAGDIDGWELVGSFAYTADNVHRWFWALRRRAEG